MVIKVADEAEELEQIYRLNHQTFAEEIPQHHPHPDKRLVDPFHKKNTYLVAKRGAQVIGMVCYNAQRPFSLDNKKVALDGLPAFTKMVEVRLLAVDQSNRAGGVVAIRLIEGLAHHLLSQGFDLAVISGITKQASLYHKIGFKPFGPLVGTPEASFQPMYLLLNHLAQRFRDV